MTTKFSTFTLSQVPDLNRTVEILDEQFQQIILAEQLGFSTAWIAEHLFSELAVMGSTQVLAGAIARATTKIRIGIAVSILPFNHPLRTASDFAAVDCMSKGRISFGTGRGYQPGEFAALGLDMANSREMYREALNIILKAWEGESFTYDGKFWKIPHPISVYPPVVQKPHPPIYTAATSRESFVDAGRNGYHILMAAITSCRANQYGWMDELQSNLAAYDNACQRAGHDPAKMERALMLACHVANRSEDAERLYAPCIDWSLVKNTKRRSELGIAQEEFGFKELKAAGGIVVGDVDHCVTRLKDLKQKLGLTEFILEFNKGGLAHSEAVQSMRSFMDEVAPRVNEEATLRQRAPARATN